MVLQPLVIWGPARSYGRFHGKANQTLLAPRLTLSQIRGLSVMVHAGGDNYSDHPKPLGGGGERIACGVIK